MLPPFRTQSYVNRFPLLYQTIPSLQLFRKQIISLIPTTMSPIFGIRDSIGIKLITQDFMSM